ncbi:MAG: Guanylate cyclase protein [Bacteroidota bacterium]|nr:Guanylate cyclase protein [Bacteroidota bacterium]
MKKISVYVNIIFKYIILIIILILFNNQNTLFAQKQGQPLIDSLLHELTKYKNDTNRVIILNRLSFAYYADKPEETKRYADEALELSRKIGFKSGEAYSLSNIGTSYWVLAQYDKALNYYKKALALEESLGNKYGIASNNANIGSIYLRKSNFPKALDYYFSSLKIYEQLNDKNGIASSLTNIGIVYRYKPDFQKALEYYRQAMKLYEELQNKSGISSTAVTIGNIYSNKGDYAQALLYYDKALKIDEVLGNRSGMTVIYGNIGLIYYKRKSYVRASEFFNKALKLSRESGNRKDLVINLTNIGELYLDMSKDSASIAHINKIYQTTAIDYSYLKKGIQYLKQAMIIGKEIGNFYYLSEIYSKLFEGYQELGNFKKALEYHIKFKQSQDSVYNREKSTTIASLEARRDKDIAEKQKDIAEKQIVIQKLYLIKARNESYLLYGGLGFMLLIITIIYRQRKISEKLLLNILPAKIAKRLKKKEKYIADRFEDASVVFIDQTNFTNHTSSSSPESVVRELNDIYTKFDKIAKKYGLEKIKTIGDCYMAASGIPEPRADHAYKAAMFAIEAMNIRSGLSGNPIQVLNSEQHLHSSVPSPISTEIQFRCGIDCGSVIAGVIGEHKFIYDIWGDTVNIASRMESLGTPGKIQVSDRFRKSIEITLQLQKDCIFSLEERGEIEVKGKGLMRTWFLNNNNEGKEK